MASCSTTEKQLKKAIERHGAKESAAYLSLNYPDLFAPQTIHYRDTIRDTVSVLIPEVTHDTTYLPSEPCTVDYHDKRLRFTVKDGNINYRIFEKEQLTYFEYKIDTVFEAQPCATEKVVDHLRGELLKKEAELAEAKSKSWFQQLRDIFFYVVIAGGIVYLYLKLKPL